MPVIRPCPGCYRHTPNLGYCRHCLAERRTPTSLVLAMVAGVAAWMAFLCWVLS